VNCLVPRNPDIRIIAQNRNYQQSLHQLDDEQARAVPRLGRAMVGIIALALFTRLVMLWRPRRVPSPASCAVDRMEVIEKAR
jgi:hypothetical protein